MDDLRHVVLRTSPAVQRGQDPTLPGQGPRAWSDQETKILHAAIRCQNKQHTRPSRARSPEEGRIRERMLRVQHVKCQMERFSSRAREALLADLCPLSPVDGGMQHQPGGYERMSGVRLCSPGLGTLDLTSWWLLPRLQTRVSCASSLQARCLLSTRTCFPPGQAGVVCCSAWVKECMASNRDSVKTCE